MVTCLNANSPVLSFADFDPATSKVVIDVAELLAHTDVAVGAQCHSFPGNEACAMPLSHAGVDYATGGTMPGQTVFSVE
jgi:hypothetical protein